MTAGPLWGEASLRRLFAEEQALSRNVLRENERLKHELSILEVGTLTLTLKLFLKLLGPIQFRGFFEYDPFFGDANNASVW